MTGTNHGWPVIRLFRFCAVFLCPFAKGEGKEGGGKKEKVKRVDRKEATAAPSFECNSSSFACVELLNCFYEEKLVSHRIFDLFFINIVLSYAAVVSLSAVDPS